MSQSSGKADPAFRDAVRLAVESAGQTGISSLAADLEAARDDVEAYRQMLATTGIITIDSIDQLTGLLGRVARLEDACNIAPEASALAPRPVDAPIGIASTHPVEAEIRAAIEDFRRGGVAAVLERLPVFLMTLASLAKQPATPSSAPSP